jgi:hypothetical protein
MSEYLFGETVAATGSHYKDRIYIRQFTSSVDAYFKEIHVSSRFAGNVKVVVYDDNGGVPNNLLTANDSGTAVVVGWNAISVPSFNVKAGEKYWIGSLSDTQGATGWQGPPNGTTEYLDVAYAGWSAPNVWPGGISTTYQSCYSAYGIFLSTDYGSNAIQQGDVWLFDGPDGGEIEEKNGFITMTKYIETLVYLCWFGGNREDDGSKATEKKQWWGNEGEPPERQYRGKLQSLLDGRPVTSALLPRIEEAALDDLKNGMPKSLFASASVYASAPSSKRVNLRAEIFTKTGTPYTVNIGVDL